MNLLEVHVALTLKVQMHTSLIRFRLYDRLSFGVDTKKKPKIRQRNPLRLFLEPLEDRTLPAVSITGTIFNDLNLNSLRSGDEIGLAGITAYLDLNRNNVFDGETSTFTGSNSINTGAFGLVNSNAHAKLTVSDLPSRISDVNVYLDITNSGTSPIIVGLVSPTGATLSGGTATVLFNGPNLLVLGQGSFNGILDEQAALPVTLRGSSGGTFQPDHAFTAPHAHIYEGNPEGTWGLVFFGNTSGLTLNSWSLSFTVAEPGTQSEVNGNFAFEDVEPGSYDVRVIAPEGGVLANGTVERTVQVVAGKTTTGVDFGIRAAPDLRGIALNLSSTPSNWGDQVSVDYVLLNNAAGAAGPFTFDVLLSADGTLGTGDLVVTTVTVPGLAAFGTTSGTVTFQLPGSAGIPPAGFDELGDAFVGLSLDSGLQVSESQETNNANQGAGIDIVSLAVPANAAISAEANAQLSPSIAVNPKDPNHLAAAYMDFGLLTTGFAGIAVSVSRNGGKTWTKHTIPLPGGFDEAAGHPVAKFDAQGRVYVTFMAAEFKGPAAPPLIYPHIFSQVVYDEVQGKSVTVNSRALGLQSNNGIFVVRSEDGGTTWNAPVAVASQVYQGPGNTVVTSEKVFYDTLPDIAIDTFAKLPNGSPNPNFGNIYATWTRFYPFGQFPGDSRANRAGADIMFAVSSNGGQTWTIRQGGNGASLVRDPFVGGSTVTAEGGGFSTISHLAVGPEGDVYVSAFLAGFFGVFRTANAGASFTAPDSIFISPTLHGLPFGGSTANQSNPTLFNNDFRTISSRAIVADPVRPGRVYAAESLPVLNSTRQGRIDAGQINFAWSDDYGLTWNHVFDTAGNSSNFEELTGSQRNDFRSVVNDDDSGRYLQFDSTLDDEKIAGQTMVQMGVDSQGNIVLVWFDTRRDPNSRSLDVYAATSSDGGLSFSKNFRLTHNTFDPSVGAVKLTDASGNKSSFLGDYIGLAVANGKFYAAWPDSRNGDLDIFFTGAALPPGLPPLGDSFEANNTPQTATDLGKISVQRQFPRLSIGLADEDWYQVTAAAAGELRVAASGSANLIVELWDSSGNNKLATGSALRDATGRLIGQTITVAAAFGENFLVRVRGNAVEPAGLQYTLIVSSLTENLGTQVHGTRSRTLAAASQNVYALTAAVSGSFELELSADNAGVSMSVLSGDGLKVLATGRTIRLPVEQGQTILIRIAGTTVNSNHTIQFTNLDQFQTADNQALSFPAGGSSSAVDVGDVNNDDILDVVTSSNQFSDVVNVFIGNADGTFQVARQYAAGAGRNTDATRDLLLHDMDDDGNLDIVVTNHNSADVSILYGRGDETFEPQRRFDAVALADSVAPGDFNGDGVLDLAVLQRASDSTIIAILIGNGDRTFKPPQTFKASFSSTAFPIRVADVNGDDREDLLVFGVNTATFQVLLSNGDGTFTDNGEFSSGEITLDAQVADINGDGTPDVITGGANTGAIFLAIGNGDGTFLAPQSFIATAPRPGENIAVGGIVLGDFGDASGRGAQDGQLDIIATTRSRSGVGSPQVVYLGGQKDGAEQFTGFSATQQIGTANVAGKLAAGDFNGDDVLDAVLANGDGLRVLYGANPTIAPNSTLATARDLGTIVHFVSQPMTIVPAFDEAFFKITVPTEASTNADQVLDFSASVQFTSGAGLNMEVLDSDGKVVASGERFRIVRRQGEELFVRIFGQSPDSAGVCTLVIDVLPQVVNVQAHSLVPGGAVTSLVITLQGDRLHAASAENPANYVIRWAGADKKFGTKDDQLINLAGSVNAKSVVYNPGANVEVASGRTFPTAVRQTITLLLDRPLEPGTYRVEFSDAIQTASFGEFEEDLLAEIDVHGGHTLVSVTGGKIQPGSQVPVDIAPATHKGGLEAFSAGTPFLTQLHNDLGAELDTLLNALGDDPSITPAITNQVLARFLPAYRALEGNVSLFIIWFDPVSIDLVDSGGTRTVYNPQANTVVSQNPQSFVEVGGNVEVIVQVAAPGTFNLNVGEVQATARGAAIILTPGGTQTVSLTDAMRGGEQSFTFNVHDANNPGAPGNPTVASNTGSGSTLSTIPSGGNFSNSLLALTTQLLVNQVLLTESFESLPGESGEALVSSSGASTPETSAIPRILNAVLEHLPPEVRENLLVVARGVLESFQDSDPAMRAILGTIGDTLVESLDIVAQRALAWSRVVTNVFSQNSSTGNATAPAQVPPAPPPEETPPREPQTENLTPQTSNAAMEASLVDLNTLAATAVFAGGLIYGSRTRHEDKKRERPLALRQH